MFLLLLGHIKVNIRVQNEQQRTIENKMSQIILL